MPLSERLAEPLYRFLAYHPRISASVVLVIAPVAIPAFYLGDMFKAARALLKNWPQNVFEECAEVRQRFASADELPRVVSAEDLIG